MKKIILLLITLALLAVIILGTRLYRMVPDDVEFYIQNKKEQLHSIAEKQVDSLFVHDHTDIFPLYRKCHSRYVKDNYWGQTGTSFRKELWDYNFENRLPEDVSTTYHTAPENPNYFVLGKDVVEDIKTQIRLNNVDNDGKVSGINGLSQKGIWQTRWAFGANENWGGGTVVQYVIIPYAVSFRKQIYGSAEDFISVDEALDFAFDFYTEHEQSKLKSNLVTDVSKFSNRLQIHNDYYSLEEDSDASVVVPTTITNSPAYEHCMYNDLFYVFVRAYGQKIYKLKLQVKYVENEKERYITAKREQILYCCSIAFGILLTIWIVFLIWVVWDIRKSKLTILQRIISKSDPRKFVKNYNGEKLKSANDIYCKAVATEESDEASIIELASRVENELGIFLISKNDIKELKALCNPKRFMKPYDAQKVERANDLFSKLSQGVMPYSTYAKIKEEIGLLDKEKKEESISLALENSTSIKE